MNCKCPKCQADYKKLLAENEYLQEILFCVGELAVQYFVDSIVGLVDRTLPKGYIIPEERYREILNDLRKGQCKKIKRVSIELE